MLRGQNNILRQGRTSSFIIREKFSFVKKYIKRYSFPTIILLTQAFTTGFVDTPLWKTKHLRKCFQNFRQSYVLSTCRIEIHQS